MSLKLLTSLWNVISPDRRPEREKAREREFILAANALKTLSVTDRGGVSIDPEELRDHINAAREQLKHLVHKAEARGLGFNSVAGQEARPNVRAPDGVLDCIEAVAWRRLPDGSAVRYVCFQSTLTGRFAVAAATLFPGAVERLPPWVDGDTTRRVGHALQNSELQWFTTVSEAMSAWEGEF